MTTAIIEHEELFQMIQELPAEKLAIVSNLVRDLLKEGDESPNAETLEACRELREGRGIKFDSVEEMFASMGFANAYAQSIGEIQPRR
jgi:hypothetical protein